MTHKWFTPGILSNLLSLEICFSTYVLELNYITSNINEYLHTRADKHIVPIIEYFLYSQLFFLFQVNKISNNMEMSILFEASKIFGCFNVSKSFASSVWVLFYGIHKYLNICLFLKTLSLFTMNSSSTEIVSYTF